MQSNDVKPGTLYTAKANTVMSIRGHPRHHGTVYIITEDTMLEVHQNLWAFDTITSLNENQPN
jgi:hypothetical protein